MDTPKIGESYPSNPDIKAAYRGILGSVQFSLNSALKSVGVVITNALTNPKARRAAYHVPTLYVGGPEDTYSQGFDCGWEACMEHVLTVLCENPMLHSTLATTPSGGISDQEPSPTQNSR